MWKEPLGQQGPSDGRFVRLDVPLGPVVAQTTTCCVHQGAFGSGPEGPEGPEGLGCKGFEVQVYGVGRFMFPWFWLECIFPWFWLECLTPKAGGWHEGSRVKAQALTGLHDFFPVSEML